MRIGVPKEIKVHEYRVGMTPGAVRIALSRIRSALITCVRSSLTEASGPHG